MITKPDPHCPSCKEPMEEGYVLDVGHFNSRQVAQWVKGEPKRGFWKGLKIDVRKQLSAFRCPKCGLVQHYALW